MLREGEADRRAGPDASGRPAVHRQADRAGIDLRRPGGDRDRERAPVRKRGGAHARIGEVAGGLADRAGSPGPDREARLARPADRRHRARDQEPAQFRQQFLGALGRTDRRIARRRCRPRHSTTRSRAEINEIADMLQRQSRQGRAARQARRFDRQEHAAAFARRAPASTGRSISTPSSRRASISPITARGPRSRASISRWSGPSIRPPARSMCSRRRSPGCCSI